LRRGACAAFRTGADCFPCGKFSAGLGLKTNGKFVINKPFEGLQCSVAAGSMEAVWLRSSTAADKKRIEKNSLFESKASAGFRAPYLQGPHSNSCGTLARSRGIEIRRIEEEARLWN
jgi:hypothetical protein